MQIIRLLAKMPTLAAFAFRHNMGQPYVYPDNDLNYAGNFLGMMYKMTELKYEPDPSPRTGAGRVVHPARRPRTELPPPAPYAPVGSTQVDPTRPVAAGVAALYGPLHGGANEGGAADARAHRARSSTSPDFLEGVKAGNERLMGFGHRVYKNYDPRARIILQTPRRRCSRCAARARCSTSPGELEKRALDDEYFTSRKLYPNVDFYSGLIYEALGLPVGDVPGDVRVSDAPAGWIAQWKEMVGDPEQKIARPRQIYTGESRHGTTCRSSEPRLSGLQHLPLEVAHQLQQGTAFP